MNLRSGYNWNPEAQEIASRPIAPLLRSRLPWLLSVSIGLSEFWMPSSSSLSSLAQRERKEGERGEEGSNLAQNYLSSSSSFFFRWCWSFVLLPSHLLNTGFLRLSLLLLGWIEILSQPFPPLRGRSAMLSSVEGWLWLARVVVAARFARCSQNFRSRYLCFDLDLCLSQESLETFFSCFALGGNRVFIFCKPVLIWLFESSENRM